MKKTKQVKNDFTKIIKHTEFRFMHLSNAQNVSLALISSGYFVKMHTDSSVYVLEVYKYN